MAESPEVPEAKDPFEKKIALSIAIVAVLLALIGAKGDHAKTEAIIQRAKASDKWAEYQAKSIKGHIAEVLHEISQSKADHGAAKPAEPAAEGENKGGKAEKAPKSAKDYEKEKDKLMEVAQEFEQESDHQLFVENKLHIAEVLLQLAVVLSSIAILTRWHVPWFVAMALAVMGTIYGALHYF